MCIKGIDLSSVSTIFGLDFGTVPTACGIFCFSIRFWNCSDSLWYFCFSIRFWYLIEKQKIPQAIGTIPKSNRKTKNTTSCRNSSKI
jgi:hypothetical protein